MALVSNNKGVVRINDLYELNSSSEMAVAGARSIKLSVGEEVCLGNKNANLLQSMSEHQVGRRRVKAFDISSGLSATKCEFSIVSLMQNTNVLNQLLTSTDDSDRAIAGKLAKMAAALSFATQGHGPYAQVQQQQ